MNISRKIREVAMVASICGIAGAPAGAEFVDFGENSFVKKIGRPVGIVAEHRPEA